MSANQEATKCNKCGLCGHHGKLQNMVLDTNEIKLTNGEKLRIQQNLNCKSHGIYRARCKTCGDFYVGQTMKSFSQRWNSHKFHWNKMIKENSWMEEEHNDKNGKRKMSKLSFTILFKNTTIP